MKRIIDFLAKNPVAITAVVFVIFYFMPFKPKPFGDGDFHIGTQQLIQYIANGFSGELMISKGFLTLFCYLIPYAIVYPFHSDPLFLLSGVLFSFLVISISVKLIFKAIDIVKVNNRNKAILLLLMCLFPIHIYYAQGIIGEVFGFFAISIWLYFWVKITKSNAAIKSTDFIFLALSLVLLYGIKPTTLPFLISFSIYLLFIKMQWKNRICYFAILSLIPMLAVVEMNLNKDGNAFKEYVFRSQIVWSRYEFRDEPFNWTPQHGVDEYSTSDYLNNRKKRMELDSICEVNNYDRNDYFIKWVINDIVENPMITLRQYSLKFFQSQTFLITPLIKSSKNNFIKYGIHIYINLINYILVVIGVCSLFKLFKNKVYTLLIPFVLFWGSSLVFIFLFHSEQRYMFPMRPILFFMFVYYFSSIKDEKKSI